MRLVMARVVWGTHVGVMLFLVLAWSLPWTGALWAAVVVYPLVQLHWWSFGNRCVLTLIEERLRRDPGVPEPAPDTIQEEPLHFVQGLLSRLLGRPVSRVWGDAVSYAVIWVGFAIASARLYARYRGAA